MRFFKSSGTFSLGTGELKNLRSLTLASLLAAIYAVSYTPFIGNIIIIRGVIEIRFGFLAIAVAGMLFGPIMAALTAVIGDILGTILFYGGSFFWGYTLSWALLGIMFGLFFYKGKLSAPRIIASMLLNTCIINLLLTTQWEVMMGFGSFQALFFKRIAHNIFMLPVNTVLMFLVLRSVLSVYRKIYTTSV